VSALCEEFLQSPEALKVIVYEQPGYPSFRAETVAGYLSERLALTTVLRDGLLSGRTAADPDSLCWRLACCRVTNPSRNTPNSPLIAEVESERRQLEAGTAQPGLVYDGIRLLQVLSDMIPRNEMTLDHIHIVFTDRLVATFDNLDRRYHLRTVICGFPCVVSLTGLVYAPARSRIYHGSRRILHALGMSEVEPPSPEDYLELGDPRTTEVSLGYAVQCVFYHLLGDPFCVDPGCRLFNAHTQREMLKAQLSLPEFCPVHAALIEEIRGSVR